MVLASRGHRWWWPVAMGLVVAALAGCGSAPPRSPPVATPIPPVVPRPGPAPSAERDGPESRPPSDLSSVPDAEPRVEAIRSGGPNRPYEQLGRGYVPIIDDRPFTERGLASWYGKKFHGRLTASGEPYNMYAMTAAHPTLPIPSYVRVLNPSNGREIVVRVNDRGPFHRGRIIDLSYTAAYKLGMLNGVGRVEVTRITFDEIRSGAWRKGTTPEPAAVERAPTDVAARVRPPAGEASSDDVAIVAAAPAMPAASPSPDEPATPPPAAKAAPGFWVQLGAFRQREGAEGFQRRVVADLDWLAPLLAVFTEPAGFRLQAGPYASRAEALGVAQRVRDSLSLVPVIVERR